MPRRLTSGAGVEGNPPLASGGLSGPVTALIYSNLTENGDIWSLPIDTDQAKVRGPLVRLTEDVGADIRPSISGDGTRRVYNSNRLGNWDVWIRDLRSGRETALAATPQNEENPKISLDGSKVVYAVVEGGQRQTYVVPVGGGLPRKVCDYCFALPWFADGKRMVFNGPEALKASLKALDTDSGNETEVLRSSIIASAPRTSRDDHWITFSQRDGARCLWAQRLDFTSKRPIGPAFAARHFHGARISPLFVKAGQLGISVARDKIVLTMDERVGNIWWMAELSQN